MIAVATIHYYYYYYNTLPMSQQNATLYDCPRCGYCTPNITNLRNHFKRKSLCQPLVADIPRPSLEMAHQCRTTTNSVPAHELIDANAALQHRVQACMQRQDELQKENHDLQERIRALERVDLQKENHDLQERIRALERLVSSIAMTTSGAAEHGASSFNTINNNNTTVNVTIQQGSSIRDFGQEDTSYITSARIEQLLRQCTPGLIELIKEVHFNPQQPQNNNVRITSKKRDMATMKRNGEWVPIKLTDAVDKTIDNSKLLLFRRMTDDPDYFNTFSEESPTCVEWQIMAMAKHQSVWRPTRNAVRCAMLQWYEDARRARELEYS